MVTGKLKIFVKSYQPSRSHCLVPETWGFEGIKGSGVEIKHSGSSPELKKLYRILRFLKNYEHFAERYVKNETWISS